MMEQKMEIWGFGGCLGIMEKKMEISGLGFRV